MRRAPDVVRHGLLIRPVLVHDGVARTLVHRLKYEASPRAASVLAAMLAARLPPDASALVPVPRVIARRWRYGVDPGRELARALARRTGLPVTDPLRPALWTARRAGPAGRRRGIPRFDTSGGVPAGAVLVDDVVTTGATLLAAANACGAARAVTVSSAVRP
ncbi:MAG TPA: ComF family protein [Acidimicrobiia bacterium]|nr:ComF family protein [Acidimicrobiia bacterium]